MTDQQFVKQQKSIDIPLDATPDVIGHMVVGVLTTTKGVQGLSITRTPKDKDRQAVLIVDFYAKSEGPPFGDLPEVPPTDIFQAMTKIKLIEAKPASSLSREAIGQVVSALLSPTRRTMGEARTPVGWMINEVPDHFLHWIGTKSRKAPSLFMGLPLFRVPFVGEDQLVLLCARSITQSPFEAEYGLVVTMEEKKV
jgi:hypothetical protein